MARIVVLVVSIAAAWCPVAQAGDGRLEINQTCALAGCFAGDAAGFPVSATTVGSYVLTSDLIVSDANATAVSLAGGSTLDLNGFAIRGVAVCTGVPAACTGTGNGAGVVAGTESTIRNGTIQGMGSSGISVSTSVRVEQVNVIGNGGVGISAPSSNGTLIRDCRVQRNGGNGVSLGAGSPRGSLVTGNSIFANGGIGIDARGVLVLGNIIDSNFGVGLAANVGSGEAAYGNNAFQNNNAGGTQVLGGQSLGGNWCEGSAC